MDIENVALRLGVRKGEFDLTIDSTGTNQGGIERFNAIGCHDDLDITTFIEPVQLIQEFQHRTLNFFCSTTRGLVTLGTHRINLINKDNGRTEIISDSKELTNQLGPVSKVLLNQFGSHHAQKGGRGLVRDSLGQQGLACTWFSVQNDSFRRFDSDIFVEFGVSQREFHCLLDLLDLFLQATNVCVGFERCLLDLHDTDHGIRVVCQNPHHTHGLVVQQDGAPGIQQILVDTTQNIHVVLGSDTGAHNGVVVVNQLFQIPHTQWRPPKFF
mmetsp:Transcript_92954/g.259771  ORF Transcript_92954/g.259771 Transcript_92954/m.259771 type:complete len:270 (-) Transcript_92954:430-1239(-)